jgi:glycosyltransferase involved in cell wall biosynthesis
MLSIIIPTLNEEKYLPKLLKNLKEKNFDNLEIIVSDANSQDQTKKIALEYNCIYVTSSIKKPAHQRNQGARKASNEIILFLDADVILPDNFLNKAQQEFKKRNLGAASFYMKFSSRKISYRIYSIFYRLICFLAQYIRPASIGAAIMVNKEVHLKIKGFREDLYVAEDYDYGYRVSKEVKFRMIRSTFFYFSNRRWEKEGQLKSIKKIITLLFHYIKNGPIKEKVVDYEFGKY